MAVRRPVNVQTEARPSKRPAAVVIEQVQLTLAAPDPYVFAYRRREGVASGGIARPCPSPRTPKASDATGLLYPRLRSCSLDENLLDPLFGALDGYFERLKGGDDLLEVVDAPLIQSNRNLAERTYSLEQHDLDAKLADRVNKAVTHTLSAVRIEFGEVWTESHDDPAVDPDPNSHGEYKTTIRTSWSVAPCGRNWVGARMEVVVADDAQLRSLQSYLASLSRFPDLVVRQSGSDKIVFACDVSSTLGSRPLTTFEEITVRISAVLGSNKVRLATNGDSADYGSLVAAGGSSFFVVMGDFADEPGGRVHHMRVSPVFPFPSAPAYFLDGPSDRPLRKILFALSLATLRDNPLQLPPRPPSSHPFSCSSSSCPAETRPMPTALGPSNADDSADAPPDAGDFGAPRGGDSGRMAQREGGFGAPQVDCTFTDRHIGTRRFTLVPLPPLEASTPPSHTFAPVDHNSATQSRAQEYLPAGIVFDRCSTAVGNALILRSSTAHKALKLVDATDAEALEEFENERAVYEELAEDLSFAMRYFGAYDLKSAYCGVATELGEPIRGWNEVDRAELLALLTVLHTRGFVHGDVRPSNLVRSSGQLRLIDFGRSRRATPRDCSEEKDAVLALIATKTGGSGGE